MIKDFIINDHTDKLIQQAMINDYETSMSVFQSVLLVGWLVGKDNLHLITSE